MIKMHKNCIFCQADLNKTKTWMEFHHRFTLSVFRFFFSFIDRMLFAALRIQKVKPTV